MIGMTRRELLALGAGAALFGVASGGDSGGALGRKLPKALKKGSRVALISPASETSDSEFLKRMEARARAMGWEPVLGKYAGEKHAYFGGTDEQRAADVMWAFTDESIDGVVSMRGGWGCARILDRLDFEVIAENPKVLMGYSDLTALLIAVEQKCGFPTFHGPVVSSTDSDYSTFWLDRAVGSGEGIGGWEAPELDDPLFELTTVVSGVGEGKLTGGNLSILASLCGTPWQNESEGRVVFMEDVEEAPYRIDRMLTQMIQAGCFKGCAGVLVGQFTRCDEKAPNSEWKVADVIRDRLGGLGVPVLAGCPIGHVKEKWTLPLGVRVKLDAGAKSVEVLESAVVG